jgi:hypothetical protein
MGLRNKGDAERNHAFHFLFKHGLHPFGFLDGAFGYKLVVYL